MNIARWMSAKAFEVKEFFLPSKLPLFNLQVSNKALKNASLILGSVMTHVIAFVHNYFFGSQLSSNGLYHILKQKPIRLISHRVPEASEAFVRPIRDKKEVNYQQLQ